MKIRIPKFKMNTVVKIPFSHLINLQMWTSEMSAWHRNLTVLQVMKHITYSGLIKYLQQ